MFFYNWFNKLINIFIELILFFAIIATLYVFTSVFSGITKVIVFILLIGIYILFIYLLKDKIKKILKKIIDKLSKIDFKTMLLIVSFVMIALKIIYSFFYNYDATIDGDIGIYDDIANQIISTRSIQTDAISHLLGMGLHLALFKLLNIPIHVGMFIAYFIGTIVNLISFKNIVGKEKAFLALMFYILMPSSTLLTFCPTHEVFLYMYLSIAIYVMNKLLSETKTIAKIIEVVLLITNIVLACFINPSGYIAMIIVGLVILFSNLNRRKKILLAIVLIVSIASSALIGSILGSDNFETSFNTYAVLIHGSNPNSLGEQVDSYPIRQAGEYLKSVDLHESHDNVLMAVKVVLIEQYKYLLSHPINLLKLIVHKFYILWSGNHYSIEMAHNFGVLSDITFYIYLCISTLIYLLMLTIGLVYAKKKKDEIYISNYKLVILGCFCITMLSVVLNKYTLYVTLFIYLISFYRIDIDENN